MIGGLVSGNDETVVMHPVPGWSVAPQPLPVRERSSQAVRMLACGVLGLAVGMMTAFAIMAFLLVA
jgi:hypothetical protein